MAPGTTTSIRLTPSLRKQLEAASQSLHRGKNWIISKALEEYLKKLAQNSLIEEARRQSLLASQANDEETEQWAQHTDTTGWI